MRFLTACLMMTGLLLGASFAAHAQVTPPTQVDAKPQRPTRDMSLQMSRYEQMIGKMDQRLEAMQSALRDMQRKNDELEKDLQTAKAKMNEEKEEAPTPWGEGQRDCTALGVKHQQLKVTVKPDGTRGVRFLCFDGKALHLGSESYVITPE